MSHGKVEPGRTILRLGLAEADRRRIFGPWEEDKGRGRTSIRTLPEALSCACFSFLPSKDLLPPGFEEFFCLKQKIPRSASSGVIEHYPQIKLLAWLR